jgi:hypothetical protein
MKKRLNIIIPVLLILTLVGWLVVWTRTPSEGRIISSQQTVTQEAPELQDKKMDGTYVSFWYDGKYAASGNIANNNDLERYTLSAGTTYDKRILAAVVNLPEGRLESNGDYVYRQKTPSVYTKRQLQTAAALFEIWVNKDNTEQTAMAAHDKKALVLSFLTTPGADDDLAREVDTVLKTLAWK